MPLEVRRREATRRHEAVVQVRQRGGARGQHKQVPGLDVAHHHTQRVQVDQRHRCMRQVPPREALAEAAA